VVGALLIGLTSYLPTYAQGVLGAGPLLAGFTLAALTLGWPLAASISGRVYLRIGFRNTALIGTSTVIVAAVFTALLTATSPIWVAGAAAFVMGVGLGFTTSPTIVAAQSVVGWDRRGVVTAANMFARSLGSAVGAAIFGAIANATLAARFADPPAEVAGQVPADLSSDNLILDAGPGPAGDFVRGALFDASHHVFLGLIALAVVGLMAVLLLPRRTRELEF